MGELIFAGKKTATRRLPEKSKRNYKVGSIQPIQMNYHDKAKGHIRILKAYDQKLGDMKLEDAKKEGFKDLADFYTYLCRINKLLPHEVFTLLSKVVKVYEFELFTLSEKERVP